MDNPNTQTEMLLAIRPFLHDVESSPDERSIERALKLALRPLPEAQRLTFFALAITAPLPHPAKAALWRVVRYSHFWWNVDALLQGDALENPIVQRAFADAVAMRRWTVLNRRPGWEYTFMTLSGHEREGLNVDSPSIENFFKRIPSSLLLLIGAIVHFEDDSMAELIPSSFNVDEVPRFVDARGNGILWYLTYREDQNAEGGFACPRTAKTLISFGADPYRENDLGLCWNDVAQHFVR
jgi:hypothetical protein